MSNITNKCNTDCNKTFPELFHQALADICFLGSVSGGDITVIDRKVAVTPFDTFPSELSDKLEGVSGINFEVETGVSGQTYVASLDLDFLDNRYSTSRRDYTLPLDIQGGFNNGFVRYCEIAGGVSSLKYLNTGNASTSWTVRIPEGFETTNNSIAIDWTAENSVSGTVVFNVEYNSISEGEAISLPYSDVVVAGFSGTPLALESEAVDVASGIISEGDLFLIKVKREPTDINDTIDNAINILGVSLIHNAT